MLYSCASRTAWSATVLVVCLVVAAASGAYGDPPPHPPLDEETVVRCLRGETATRCVSVVGPGYDYAALTPNGGYHQFETTMFPCNGVTITSTPVSLDPDLYVGVTHSTFNPKSELGDFTPDLYRSISSGVDTISLTGDQVEEIFAGAGGILRYGTFVDPDKVTGTATSTVRVEFTSESSIDDVIFNDTLASDEWSQGVICNNVVGCTEIHVEIEIYGGDVPELMITRGAPPGPGQIKARRSSTGKVVYEDRTDSRPPRGNYYFAAYCGDSVGCTSSNFTIWATLVRTPCPVEYDPSATTSVIPSRLALFSAVFVILATLVSPQ